jgi:serine/threonine protein kinase
VLQAQNILLQTNTSEARGVTAKVSDFGLSMCIAAADTHVSKAFQGTLTHMAPEVLLKGIQSTASDV